MTYYDFIKWCEEHEYRYDKGYSWCECNDFGDYVNVIINGKWHTLYCLNDGGYRFDKTIVKSLEDIERVLK